MESLLGLSTLLKIKNPHFLDVGFEVGTLLPKKGRPTYRVIAFLRLESILSKNGSVFMYLSVGTLSP